MYIKIDTAINSHIFKLKQYNFNTFHWMILIMWSNTFLLVSINRKTHLQISQFMLMYYLYILKQIY